MCFSATASFVASGVLLSAGIAAVFRAVRLNKRYVLLACMPIFFAIQQMIEGLIWVRLGAGDADSAHAWSYVYLFFAFTFWPAYLPTCIYFIEREAARCRQLFLLIIAGMLLGAMIYVPILLGMVPFNTLVLQHAISYSVIYSSWQCYLYSITYVTISLLALYITQNTQMRIFAFLIALSFVVTMISYWYAFTSVWCFFAAILSLYILRIVYVLR